MIVVDASILLEILLRTSVGVVAEERTLGSGETLHAPYLLDVEVAQVLRRYAVARQVTVERCRAALNDLAAFKVQRYPHEFLLPRIWELRNNLSAYDAAYVALAEELDAVLLTHDRRLAAAPVHRARIELV